MDGCTTLDTLGLTFSVKGGVKVKARSDRAWRLWGATRALLRRRWISGEVLRVWLGHVNFHFLLTNLHLTMKRFTLEMHQTKVWIDVYTCPSAECEKRDDV